MSVIPSLSGGLGNRLFQLYAALGLGEQLQREVLFSLTNAHENNHDAAETIYRLFPQIPLHVAAPESRWPLCHWRETANHHTFQPFDEQVYPGQTIIVDGYRQSALYFPKLLPQPNWNLACGGAAALEHLASEAGLTTPEERRRTWLLHCRLGDYKKLRHHMVNLDKYYRRALEKVPSGSRVLFFSDEPEFCEDIFKGLCLSRGLDFALCTATRDCDALYVMSLCQGGAICANSTFSWWGAFFAATRGTAAEFKCYMPDTWGSRPNWPKPTGLALPWSEFISVT